MGNKCTKPDSCPQPNVTDAPSRVESSSSDEKGAGLRSGLVRSSVHRSVWEMYEKGKKLGSGMTGDVFQVTHKITNQQFALKSMERRKINPDLIEDLRNEIGILKVLDHPNVIKLYETFEDSDNIYLVLELCTGGELYDRLHAQEGRHYREPEAARLVFKMLSAIAYCHKRGISHRDLKLENFIFDSEAADSNLKLIDFGLSKKYGNGIRRMQTMVGTPYYMAPEVAAEAGAYSEACDVWSIGVITYMLLTGTPPFRGDNDHAVLAAVKAAKYTMTGPRWEHISDQAKDFVSCLLRKNPKHRLTAEQALKHDFLKSTEVAIQTMKMSSSVLDSLKRFQHYSTMKRVALEAIAFSLNAAQVQEMRRAFVKIDKNCSGYANKEGFIEILTNEGMSRQEARAIYHHMDREGKGSVSYSEFLGATLDRKYFLQADRIREAFQRLDVTNCGFISARDLQFVMGTEFDEQALRKMLVEADVGTEGRIDFQDFLRIVVDETRYDEPVRESIGKPLEHAESKLSTLAEDGEDDDEYYNGGSTTATSPSTASHIDSGRFPSHATGPLAVKLQHKSSDSAHVPKSGSEFLGATRPPAHTKS